VLRVARCITVAAVRMLENWTAVAKAISRAIMASLIEGTMVLARGRRSALFTCCTRWRRFAFVPVLRSFVCDTALPGGTVATVRRFAWAGGVVP
jgi:hypothetical protein